MKPDGPDRRDASTPGGPGGPDAVSASGSRSDRRLPGALGRTEGATEPAAEPPFPLERVKVRPLAERNSLSRCDDTLIDPDADPAPVSPENAARLDVCAADVRRARERGAAVMLIYGAHLLRNGVARIVDRMLDAGWITHLATNGAGSIHDWEYAFQGRSLETVRAGVATGTFGAWDETGRNLMLALLAGNLRADGYGAALGRFIAEDGTTLPAPAELEAQVRAEPAHPFAPARADLLRSMRQFGLPAGRLGIEHPWKQASILHSAHVHGVPMTVHPGIGYDIIAVHPMFDGAVVGRAAGADFRRFCGSVDNLDDGVVLSIGSAIMGPQVFEKALSCVHNVRLQDGRPLVTGHSLHVVDLQDGGGWDWSTGEPPKTSPAYYLRFCKSYARMGGTLHYTQCDNAAFLHNLYQRLDGF